MDWLQHPKFVGVRDEVLYYLKQKTYQFRKVGKVLFLCGGRKSLRRDRLAEYLHRYHQESLTFYAETVWTAIAQRNPDANALEVEERLADLADAVIIIVESPGTFAELGAFAISKPLRKKLLPILDRKYIQEDSFLKTGPVSWIDKESQFAPSIWACLDQILEVIDQIKERLDRIPKPKPTQIPNLFKSPKHLVFFICDLVAIFGPCPLDHLIYFTRNVLGDGELIDIPLLLGLSKAMRLLDSFLSIDGREMFFRPLTNGHLTSFQYTKRFLDIPTLRARVVSVMLSCPFARIIIEQMEAKHGAH